MLKYLACIDLAHRHYSIELNKEIGNKCGLKLPMYQNVVRNVLNILQIKLNSLFYFIPVVSLYIS